MVKRLGGIHPVLVDQAVHLLYRVDLFRRETAAVETDGIDAAERNRFARNDGERRDVFVDLRPALNHHMSADMAELMHERTTADDREIIYFHFVPR